MDKKENPKSSIKVRGPVKGKIEFISYHKPRLISGEYRMMTTQSVGSKQTTSGKIQSPFTNFSLNLSTHKTLEEITNYGCKSIIVSRGIGADTGLHFRVFDHAGKVIRDEGEDSLVSRKELLVELKTNMKPPKGGSALTGAQTTALMPKVCQILGEAFSSSNSFTVAGERYRLNPNDVVSVFPPDKSLGDHANVMPHVILKRSTLPWERTCDKEIEGVPANSDITPWMCILSFDDNGEAELKPKTIKLGAQPKPGVKPDDGTLYGDGTVSYYPPEYVHGQGEGGEKEDDLVQVIDLPFSWIEGLLPKCSELPYLAHVRKRLHEDGRSYGQEQAVILGNRLPNRGKSTVSFLVSLEHRFIGDHFWHEGGKNIRFVVLKSWKYACLDETSYRISQKFATSSAENWSEEAKTLFAKNKPSIIDTEIVGEKAFEGCLTGLGKDEKAKIFKKAQFKKLSFKNLLMELSNDTLRLPKTAMKTPEHLSQDDETFLSQGKLILPQRFRDGAYSGSVYHGPLISGHHMRTKKMEPVHVSDHLLKVNLQRGVLDVSYAAAWELGRLMMLSSKKASIALFNWKRAIVHKEKGKKARKSHLPFNGLPGRTQIPDLLGHWLYDLALLKNVPFHYIVPDPQMLPKESIRFFQLDRHWVECLLDGAFSIGRVNTNDLKIEKKHPTPLQIARHSASAKTLSGGEISGVLIRSQAVEGWPDLKIDGYAILSNHTSQTRSINALEQDLSSAVPLSRTAIEHLNICGFGLDTKGSYRSEVETYITDENNKRGVDTSWTVRDADNNNLFSIVRIEEPDVEHHLEIHLERLRFVHLSKSVVCGLFEGRISAVDVHLKPEAIHCGVSEPDPDHKGHHFKVLRNVDDGVEMHSMVLEPILWRGGQTEDSNDHVLDIDQILNGKPGSKDVKPIKGISEILVDHKMLSTKSAMSPEIFAMQMIEGVERVRFMLSGTLGNVE